MKVLPSLFLNTQSPNDELWENFHVNTKLSEKTNPPVSAAADPIQSLNTAVNTLHITEIEVVVGGGGKKYPTAHFISLPSFSFEGVSKCFGKVLQDRASSQTFSGRSLSLNEIAMLCQISGGRNPKRFLLSDSHNAARFVPSGGALHPLELYLLFPKPIQSESGNAGAEVWHYEPGEHRLERIACVPLQTIKNCFQYWPDPGPSVVFLYTGVPKRQSWKYGARGYRYTILEAGHAAQNLLLCATSMELRACPVASFYDDALHDLLDIDGVSEIAIYSAFVGTPEN